MNPLLNTPVLTTRQQKLEAAIAYLRSRNKYIIDPDCTFTPTNPAATDVKRTMEEARK
jgi:hypothetical protein